MNTDQVMNQIENEMKQAPKPTLFICCQNCGKVSGWNKSIPVPTKCGSCGHEGAYGVGPTEEEAKNKASMLARGEKPVQAAQPAPAQAAQPAPKPKRPRKEQAEQLGQAEPTNEDGPATNIGVNVTGDRSAGLALLVGQKALNAVQVKPVCKAQVYALGFTEWIEKDGQRVPLVTIKEPTDDSQSFRDLLNAARRKDGRVCVDVARLTGFNESVAAALFNFTLDASIFTPSGPIVVKVGDTVEVGAKLSKTGHSLIWQVLKVC